MGESLDWNVHVFWRGLLIYSVLIGLRQITSLKRDIYQSSRFFYCLKLSESEFTGFLDLQDYYIVILNLFQNLLENKEIAELVPIYRDKPRNDS